MRKKGRAFVLILILLISISFIWIPSIDPTDESLNIISKVGYMIGFLLFGILISYYNYKDKKGR